MAPVRPLDAADAVTGAARPASRKQAQFYENVLDQ